MKNLAIFAGVAALAWGVGGCSDDTKAENEVEAQADAVEAQAEPVAEAEQA